MNSQEDNLDTNSDTRTASNTESNAAVSSNNTASNAQHKRQTQSKFVKLDDSVQFVRRQSTLLLVSGTSGATVRVSPGAEPLIPSMEKGTQYDELVNILSQKHPNVRDVRPTLNKFLAQLSRSQLMEGEEGEGTKKPRGRTRRYELFNPDPMAKSIAHLIQKIPAPITWGFLAIMIIASVICVFLLPSYTAILHPSDVAGSFNLVAFLIFFLIIVPIHEAGHAIACRLVGSKVSGAGIIMHQGIVPGPYVETSKAYSIKEKSHRFWIPAAGPIVNLSAAGVMAWIIILNPQLSPYALEVLVYVFILSMLFVYFDTNPFTASDGSHMLEALLDDELARRSAFSNQTSNLSDKAGVAIYKKVSIAHLIIAILVLVYWWY